MSVSVRVLLGWHVGVMTKHMYVGKSEDDGNMNEYMNNPNPISAEFTNP